MAKAEARFDSEKTRREIFEASNKNIWTVIEFVAETARLLAGKQRVSDFMFIVDTSIKLRNDNLMLKILLSRIVEKCDGNLRCKKLLIGYLFDFGKICLNLGQPKKAIHCYEKCLAISIEVGDQSLTADICVDLGNVYSNVGEYKKAIRCHEKSLAISSERGDQSSKAKSNGNLGNTYCKLGEYQKAIYFYEEGIKISTEMKDQSGISIKYGNLGIAYLNMGQTKKALECYENSLKISTQIGDRFGIQSNLSNLGNAHFKMGDYKKAIKYYNKSIVIGNEIGDQSSFAANIGNLGNAYSSLGDWEKAIQYYKKALESHAAFGDVLGISRDKGNLGCAYKGMGQYKKAIQCFEEVIAIKTKIGDQAGIAGIYANLGSVYVSMGEYEKSIQYIQKSLVISSKIGNRSVVAAGNENFAIVYRILGQLDKSIEYSEKSLSISTEIGDRPGIATSYENLGTVYSNMGQTEKAIQYYSKSLVIFIKFGMRSDAADVYNSLGNVYLSISEYVKARQYFEKGLTIHIDIGNKPGIANSNGSLGVVYLSMEQYKKAVLFIEKSLEINIETGDQLNIASNYTNLGSVCLSLGQYAKAVQHFEQALAISSKIGEKAEIGNKLGNLGCAWFSLGQFEKAIHYFEQAYEISVEIGKPWMESVSVGNIGYSYYVESVIQLQNNKTQSLSQLELAIPYLKRSVECSDKMFSDMNVDEHKISFTNEYFRRYQTLMSCFILLTRYEAALLVIDLAKAKSLHVSIEKHWLLSTYDIFDYTSLTWKNLCDEKEKDQINEIKTALLLKGDCSTVILYSFDHYMFLNIWVLNESPNIVHVISVHKGGAPSVENCISKSLLNLLSIFDLNLDRGASLFRKMDSGSTPGQLKEKEILQNAKPLSDVFIKAMQDSGSSDHRLPKPVNSTRREYRSHSRIFRGEVPKDSQVLNTNIVKVVNVYDLAVSGIHKTTFSRKRLDYLDISMLNIRDVGFCTDDLRSLYLSLIYPVKEFIKGTKLIIVPDKFLFFVPFSSLLDENGRFLSKNYSIQISPSLHTLFSSTLAKQDILSPALFVGNPTVGKVNFERTVLNVPALPSATEEVASLAARFDAKPLVELEATKCEVLKRVQGSSIIHIAAHGDRMRGEIFLAPNPEWVKQGVNYPKEKFYLLSEKDIIEMHIHARLVVLCCCHTGRGEISSEGVIGLARAFLAAGAQCVLAALWPIHDEGTKLFMGSFYDEIHNEISACEALKRTMNIFQNHGNCFCRLFPVWAPFTIFGSDIKFTRQEIEEIKWKSRELVS